MPSVNATEETVTKGGNGASKKCANAHGRPSSVEAALGLVETLGNEGMESIGGTRDDRLSILVRIEWREHVIGNIARIPAPRPTHTDPQTKELRRAERLRYGTKPVVASEPTAEPRL